MVNETDAILLLRNGYKLGLSYNDLSNSGITLTTEPFFKSLLVIIHRNHVHELLSRARILLPPEEARLMMGVMDETGVLKPGQVCVFSIFSSICIRKVKEYFEYTKIQSTIMDDLVVKNVLR